jgi:hypothetical protein
VFLLLAVAIMSRPEKWLSHFDQSLYLTIAYDLIHHGVFSNGVLDDIDSTTNRPQPGRFFGPAYPWLIVVAMKLDPRFARAVDCVVEADHGARNGSECEPYARPMLIMHAVLLAVGVLSIALASEIIFADGATFWLAGTLATTALLPDIDLFSFVMTESVTFSLYSIAALALVWALHKPVLHKMLLTGVLFGALTMTRASFAVLMLLVPALIVVNGRWILHAAWGRVAGQAAAFAIAWMVAVSPWLIRNAESLGKWGLTEEYASVTLIERFAYNDMTAREFMLAFPYCLPGIGRPLVERLAGPDAMRRFDYDTPGSFFQKGRHHREDLVKANHRLDPLILDIAREEMVERWGRHLLASIALGWCGLWIGGIFGLVLVPLFIAASVMEVYRSKPLFLLYSVPPVAMLALHAVLANPSTRYNLIMIGPFSAGAAWLIVRGATLMHKHRQAQTAQQR